METVEIENEYVLPFIINICNRTRRNIFSCHRKLYKAEKVKGPIYQTLYCMTKIRKAILKDAKMHWNFP